MGRKHAFKLRRKHLEVRRRELRALTIQDKEAGQLGSHLQQIIEPEAA